MKKKIERLLELEGDQLHDAVMMLLCNYEGGGKIRRHLQLRRMDAVTGQRFAAAEKIDRVVDLIGVYEGKLLLKKDTNETE